MVQLPVIAVRCVGICLSRLCVHNHHNTPDRALSKQFGTLELFARCR
jgi:hypothetical protein